jgi:acetylornithine/LysW-gamma-L-lysine aminotransferase
VQLPLQLYRVLESERLPERAAESGDYLLARLHSLNLEVIREVRGLGLMVGIEIKRKVTPYLQELMAHGILALPAGLSVIRLLPPLVITKGQIDQVVETLEEVLAS